MLFINAFIKNFWLELRILFFFCSSDFIVNEISHFNILTQIINNLLFTKNPTQNINFIFDSLPLFKIFILTFNLAIYSIFIVW